jgi:glycerophosphoryl diester phosphodiesterase
MPARRLPLLLLLCLAVALTALPAGALPQRTLLPFGENPWLERQVLNIAHRGGDLEFPENTLYAFHRALEAGADVLEMDLYATADGEVIVLHDATVDRTTDGTGRADELTLAEVQSLDAAHWFVPGRRQARDAAPEAYVYRGIATGAVEPPEGFAAEDFRIPTLREVLEAFPDALLNLELKDGLPTARPFHQQVADLLAEFDRSDDVIVASFIDTYIEPFKLVAPHVPTAMGTLQAAVFKVSTLGGVPGLPNPRYQALQVPTDLVIEVTDEDFVAGAHRNGLAVHVWTINDRETMERLLDLGVDGIMTDRPSLLHELLVERGLAEPRPVEDEDEAA